MNNILEERDRAITERKRVKRHLDNIINLSESDKGERLLDEGAVVVGEDYVRFIIQKGTFDKFMNGENEYLPNIDANYKGFINLGHEDFYANPISLIGSWTKDDLTLVDIGNGRKGIDVNVKLWDWHPFSQIIHNLPYSVGISAEFYAHANEELTDETGYIVYDEICITDFAVVGNGANVNSNGLMLKGEQAMKDIEKLQESLNEMLEDKESEITEGQTDAEEQADEVEEAQEGDEEQAEETAEVETNSVNLDEILSRIEALTAEIDSLKDENANLKSTLADKDEDMKRFQEKFSSLSVKLNPALSEKHVTSEKMTDRYDGHNDGIGV